MALNPLPRGRKWSERRLASTSDLASWNAREWRDWFADGLRIWFSDWSAADRAFAFAPLHIAIGREVMAEAVADYLQRFYKSGEGRDAAATLDLISEIESGAEACMRRSVILSDCRRAEFMLQVFEILASPGLPELACLSLQTLPSKAFDDPEAEEYLSRLTYIILDNNAVRGGDKLQGLLEERLRRCENFRPALSYSLQLTTDDVLLGLERFCDLTDGIPEPERSDVWGEVSEEFDKRFGRSVVAAAVERASNSSLMEDISNVGAMVAAMRMAPMYIGTQLSSIFSADLGYPPMNEIALQQRDIRFHTVYET